METGNGKRETGDGRQETGDGKREARRRETGGKETGDRKRPGPTKQVLSSVYAEHAKVVRVKVWAHGGQV
jgi:hypothetical protein